MKGLAELTFGPSRPLTLFGRRLAGRFSKDTDLKEEKGDILTVFKSFFTYSAVL